MRLPLQPPFDDDAMPHSLAGEGSPPVFRATGFVAAAAWLFPLAAAMGAPTFTDTQIQAVARAIVLSNCAGADTTSPTTFEKELLAGYPGIANGGGTSLEKALSKEATELYELAQEGVQPHDYGTALLALDSPLIVPAAASSPAASQAQPKVEGSPSLAKASANVAAANDALAKNPQDRHIPLMDIQSATQELKAAANPPPLLAKAAVEVQAAGDALGTKNAPDVAIATTNLQAATEDLSKALAITTAPNVSHFFVSAAYQVSDPYVFSPPGPSTMTTSTSSTSGGTTTTTTTTTTSPPSITNGTIKPSTTSGILLELDYLNRLAWDRSRTQKIADSDRWKGDLLKPWDLNNWDIEGRLFFSLSPAAGGSSTSTSGSSTTTSSGPNVSATALEGSGNFGAEVAVVQNVLISNDDPDNFQTFGLEERFGGLSDRSSYRNHAEEFVGVNYTVGLKSSSASNSEPLRLNFRAGYDWLDTVSFLNETNTQIITVNGAPQFGQRGFETIQSEALVPVGTNAFITVGGRVYFGTGRPAPWTSYIGYTIDLPSLAQALHLGGGTSAEAKPSGDSSGAPSGK